MKILGKVIDERYLNHRLRSGCFGGIAGFIVANLLLAYRYFVNHIWSGDLLAVAGAISLVTFVVMVWYLLRE